MKYMMMMVVVGLATMTGCSPTVTEGARALLPTQNADTSAVWIYIEASDDDKTGVYRCADTGATVQCRRAPLVDR